MGLVLTGMRALVCHFPAQRPRETSKKLTEPDLSKVYYRLGVVHGFTFALPAEPAPEIRALGEHWTRGVVRALVRPAILMDAFDSKCGDYRNLSAPLAMVGELIILELGGVETWRIDEALRVLRAGGNRLDMYKALVAP